MKIYKKVSITAGLLLFVIGLPSLGEPYEYCYHNCEVTHNNPYRSFERPHDSRLLIQCRKQCDEAFPIAAEKAEKKAEKEETPQTQSDEHTQT